MSNPKPNSAFIFMGKNTSSVNNLQLRTTVLPTIDLIGFEQTLGAGVSTDIVWLEATLSNTTNIVWPLITDTEYDEYFSITVAGYYLFQFSYSTSVSTTIEVRMTINQSASTGVGATAVIDRASFTGLHQVVTFYRYIPATSFIKFSMTATAATVLRLRSNAYSPFLTVSMLNPQFNNRIGDGTIVSRTTTGTGLTTGVATAIPFEIVPPNAPAIGSVNHRGGTNRLRMFDASTAGSTNTQLVVKYDSVYLVVANIQLSNQDTGQGVRTAWILLNNTTILAASSSDNVSGTQRHISISLTTALVAGDYLQVIALQNTVNSTIAPLNNCNFAAYDIGSA